MCERNRRHHIREGFSNLQRKRLEKQHSELVTDDVCHPVERLPNGTGTKMSKMEVLRAGNLSVLIASPSS